MDQMACFGEKYYGCHDKNFNLSPPANHLRDADRCGAGTKNHNP